MEIQTQGYIKEKNPSSKNSLVSVTWKLVIFSLEKSYFVDSAVQSTGIKQREREDKENWFSMNAEQRLMIGSIYQSIYQSIYLSLHDEVIDCEIAK